MSRDVETRVREANLITRDEQLEQLFGEDLSHRLLGHIRARKEGRMTDTTSDKQQRGNTSTEPIIESVDTRPRDPGGSSLPKKAPRRWIPAVVAAAVVLLLGIPSVVWLADSSPFAGRELTPVEIAEAYIEARNAYDAERARDLVSDDFRTSEAPDGFRDLEGMELAFESHQAYGFHYSEVNCSPSGETSEGVAVACDYLWTTELHRIGDHPPTPERLTFMIEDGRIERIIRSGGAFGSWWNPFFNSFLGSEHPEFRDVVARSLDLDPDSARELVEMLPQYFDLYEEWLTSQEE